MSLKAKPFGAVDTVDHVPGAEVLDDNEDDGVEIDSGSESGSDDSDWIDIPEENVTKTGTGTCIKVYNV